MLSRRFGDTRFKKEIITEFPVLMDRRFYCSEINGKFRDKAIFARHIMIQSVLNLSHTPENMNIMIITAAE